MIERKVRIINKAGLHTRPASMIVKIAAKYKSEFFCKKQWIDLSKDLSKEIHCFRCRLNLLFFIKKQSNSGSNASTN